MKKMWKRALAVLCALTMIVGGVMTWNGQVTEAEAETTEWDFTNKVVPISSIVGSGNPYMWCTYSAGVTLPGDLTKEQLTLFVSLEIDEDMDTYMDTHGGLLRVTFGEGGNTAYWDINVSTLKLGTNELHLQLSNPTNDAGLDISAPLNKFLMEYYDNSATDGTAYYDTLCDDIPLNKVQVMYRSVWDFTNKVVPISSIVGSGNPYMWCSYSAGVTLPSDVTKDELTLFVSLELSAGMKAYMDTQGGLLRITFGEGSNFAYWDINVSTLKLGTNELPLQLSSPTNTSGTGLNISATVSKFLMEYYDNSATDGTAYYDTLCTDLPLNKVQVMKIAAEEVNPNTSEWQLNGIENRGYAWETANLGLDITNNVQEEDLMLYLKLDLNDNYEGQMNATGGYLQIELSNDTATNGAYVWQVDAAPLNVGENVLPLKLSEATKTGSAPDLTQTFKYFRVWWYVGTSGTSSSGLANNSTLTVAKLVRYTPYVKEYQSNAWELATTKLTNIGYAWYATELAFNVTGNVQEADLELQLSFDIDKELVDRATGALVVQLGNDSNNNYAWYTIAIANLEEGPNEFSLKLSNAVKTGNPNLSSTLNYFRFYDSVDATNGLNGTSASKVTLNKIQVVKTGAWVEAGSSPETLGLDVSDVPEGYIFAGWYDNETCETVDALEGTANGTVYAKFVRDGILDVKMQYSQDGSKLMRFVTTVDSLQYKEVGFDITMNNNTIPKTSTTVYKELYAVGSNEETFTYVPNQIDAASVYFNAYTLDCAGIPAGTTITVKTFWITQDGTKVSGAEATYNVDEYFQ